MNTKLEPVPSAYFVKAVEAHPEDFVGHKEGLDSGDTIYVITHKYTMVAIASLQTRSGLETPNFMDSHHFRIVDENELLFVRNWVNDWLRDQEYQEILNEDKVRKNLLESFYETSIKDANQVIEEE